MPGRLAALLPGRPAVLLCQAAASRPCSLQCRDCAPLARGTERPASFVDPCMPTGRSKKYGFVASSPKECACHQRAWLPPERHNHDGQPINSTGS